MHAFMRWKNFPNQSYVKLKYNEIVNKCSIYYFESNVAYIVLYAILIIRFCQHHMENKCKKEMAAKNTQTSNK